MKLHSCRMLKIFWNHAKATQVLYFFQIPKRRAKKKKKKKETETKTKTIPAATITNKKNNNTITYAVHNYYCQYFIENKLK